MELGTQNYYINPQGRAPENVLGRHTGRWRRLRQIPEPRIVRVHDSTKRLATSAEVRVLEAVLREVLLVRAHGSEFGELVEVVH